MRRAKLRRDGPNAHDRRLRLPPNGHAWCRSTAPRPVVFYWESILEREENRSTRRKTQVGLRSTETQPVYDRRGGRRKCRIQRQLDFPTHTAQGHQDGWLSGYWPCPTGLTVNSRYSVYTRNRDLLSVIAGWKTIFIVNHVYRRGSHMCSFSLIPVPFSDLSSHVKSGRTYLQTEQNLTELKIRTLCVQ